MIVCSWPRLPCSRASTKHLNLARKIVEDDEDVDKHFAYAAEREGTFRSKDRYRVRPTATSRRSTVQSGHERTHNSYYFLITHETHEAFFNHDFGSLVRLHRRSKGASRRHPNIRPYYVPWNEEQKHCLLFIRCVILTAI
jgi:hypothetical protein